MEFKVRASPGDVDEQLQRKARTADSVIRRGLEELGERGEATMRGFAPSLGGMSASSAFAFLNAASPAAPSS